MRVDIRYVRVLVRWAWLFVLAALLAGGASYWVAKQQPAVYEARARLIVGPGIDSPNPDLNALRTGSQLMQTYAKLATTRPVLEAVIRELGLQTTPEQLKKLITIKTDRETQILTVVVEDTDPVRAANVANATAEMLVRLSAAAASTKAQVREQILSEIARLQEIVATSETRIRELEEELATLEAEEENPDPTVQELIRTTEIRIRQLEALLRTAEDITTQQLLQDQITQERNRLFEIRRARSEQRRFLVNQLTQERARLTDAHRTLAQLYTSLQESTTNQVKIVEPAVTGYPMASQLRLRVLMGAVGGLLLTLLVVQAFEYLDSTVQDERDLERLVRAPVLGAVVAHRAPVGTGPEERLVVLASPDSRAAESYRMLGARLQFEARHREVRTIMVTTPVDNEEVAVELAANVAVALAEMGERVILVDANTRHPAVGDLFGLPPETPGLADMLSGEAAPVPLVVERVAGLSVVPAGISPEGEVLRAPAPASMISLLDRIKAKADLVLIVAPPLLAFAHSLIVAARVDGVVLVACRGETSRESVSRAVQQLRSLGVELVGAVLGSKPLIRKGVYRWKQPGRRPGLSGPGPTTSGREAPAAGDGEVKPAVAEEPSGEGGRQEPEARDVEEAVGEPVAP